MLSPILYMQQHRFARQLHVYETQAHLAESFLHWRRENGANDFPW